ncbi:MAG: murein L,D-transpeptidase catalytic domain-containing protein [Erythrobacter sp.]
MNLSRRGFIGALGLGAGALIAPSAAFAAVRSDAQPALLAQARAALAAQGARVRQRDVIGLVDFAAPSGARRFQIVDLGNGRILASKLVAHGRGSDPANTGFLQKFSNRHGSYASSAGSYLVGDTYYGKYGRSRRLHGLDPENDQAFARAIVIHSANYVSPHMAEASGRVGRSLGCFTVANSDISEVLGLLGPGSLLFAGRSSG